MYSLNMGVDVNDRHICSIVTNEAFINLRLLIIDFLKFDISINIMWIYVLGS